MSDIDQINGKFMRRTIFAAVVAGLVSGSGFLAWQSWSLAVELRDGLRDNTTELTQINGELRSFVPRVYTELADHDARLRVLEAERVSR